MEIKEMEIDTGSESEPNIMFEFRGAPQDLTVHHFRVVEKYDLQESPQI